MRRSEGPGAVLSLTTTLSTDVSGSETATAAFSSLTGNVLTATATDADGNTSEFSQCGDVTTLGVSSSPSARTVTQGASALYTITVTAQGGTFDETVALTCSGAPTQAACAFSEDEITLVAGQASATMTVTTAAPARGPPLSPGAVPEAACPKVGKRIPTRVRWAGLVVLGGLVVLFQASCGKDGTSPPTGGNPRRHL